MTRRRWFVILFATGLLGLGGWIWSLSPTPIRSAMCTDRLQFSDPFEASNCAMSRDGRRVAVMFDQFVKLYALEEGRLRHLRDEDAGASEIAGLSAGEDRIYVALATEMPSLVSIDLEDGRVVDEQEVPTCESPSVSKPWLANDPLDWAYVYEEGQIGDAIRVVDGLPLRYPIGPRHYLTFASPRAHEKPPFVLVGPNGPVTLTGSLVLDDWVVGSRVTEKGLEALLYHWPTSQIRAFSEDGRFQESWKVDARVHFVRIFPSTLDLVGSSYDSVTLWTGRLGEDPPLRLACRVPNAKWGWEEPGYDESSGVIWRQMVRPGWVRRWDKWAVEWGIDLLPGASDQWSTVFVNARGKHPPMRFEATGLVATSADGRWAVIWMYDSLYVVDLHTAE